MNNYQWLLQMDGADRKAWFDAEHVEHQERALDGDTEPENADSREKLEADVFKAADEMDRFYCGEKFIDTRKIIGWLDRQAAITDREWEAEQSYLNAGYKEQIAELKGQVFTLKCECEDLENELHKLTAERDRLKSRICELEDDLVRANDERDNWKANCEDWKKHARAAENACYETMLEREEYRKLFGMALDWAHEITMLESSVDEGMA